MYRALVVSASLTLLLSGAATAQSIRITPPCGTGQTHFVVSVAGIPVPGCNGNTCFGGPSSMTVDGHDVPVANWGSSYCRASGTFDLTADILASGNCPGCLSVGTHTVQFATLTECGVQERSGCVTGTYEVQISVANPWSYGFDIVSSHVVGIDFKYLATSPCGSVPCDTIQMIQTIRRRGVYGNGASRHLTRREMIDTWPASPAALQRMADSLDAWTTPIDSVNIDLARDGLDIPYLTNPRTKAVFLFGRSNNGSTPASYYDRPQAPDLIYPAGLVKIILDAELSAFCAAGPGRGRYLGTVLWHWERNKGAGSFAGDLGLVTTADGPSAKSVAAIERYIARTQFPFPRPQSSTGGGSPCSP